MKHNDIRSAAISARKRFESLDNQAEEARQEYRRLVREYSAAVAFDAYGFQVGDVIEFTHKSWRGKAESVRMKITGFSADPDYDNDRPSISGIRIKKDGTVGTKQEHCYPSLSEYSNIRKVQS